MSCLHTWKGPALTQWDVRFYFFPYMISTLRSKLGLKLLSISKAVCQPAAVCTKQSHVLWDYSTVLAAWSFQPCHNSKYVGLVFVYPISMDKVCSPSQPLQRRGDRAALRMKIMDSKNATFGFWLKISSAPLTSGGKVFLCICGLI